MEKEMGKGKNIIIMVIQNLKENIQKGKDGMEKVIIELVIQNLK